MVQGTASTRKRKQRKLKRVQAAVKKAERREEGGRHESFAALQLLHDPQVRAVGWGGVGGKGWWRVLGGGRGAVETWYGHMDCCSWWQAE